MYRIISQLLLSLALANVPAHAIDLRAADPIEAQVQEIEQLAGTAPARESNAKIDALEASDAVLSLQQGQRIEFVRLRNLALAADQAGALKGLTELLKQELPAAIRIRAYATAINVAANLEYFSLAFTWLNAAMAYVSENPSESGRLLGVASYLHTLVGETGKARELALQALRQVEATNDSDALCVALSDMALTEDHAHNYSEAEKWRHRQIEACTRAGDPVFIANGKYGVGKMALSQGHAVEALKWGREALAEFEAVGFVAGAYSTRLLIAQSLIESGEGLNEADSLLKDTLQYYRQQKADFSLVETELLVAKLAERRGNLAAALSHTKQAMAASKAAESGSRESRLAYLQVEFDTQLKEQQIALLETERALATVQATATKRRQWLLAVGVVGLLVTAILLLIVLRRSFRERRRYRWQSEHDSLTRLLNYQQVRKLGEEALTRARSVGRPFTAIVVDIDLFKKVNDRYGHAAGDEALRSLGAWINETVGENGIAGRSGGDEFTILIDADAEEAEAMMRRLCDRIEPMTVFGQTFCFGVSFGVCQADENASSLEQLIHEADQALYRAKHQGHDRAAHARKAAIVSEASACLGAIGSGVKFDLRVSEQCLYADLNLDPGHRGVQAMEASHFLVYDRQLDPAGLVILWQVVLSCTRLHADRDSLQALVDKLLRWYPPEHEVILYEAVQLPIESPRAERFRLCDLPMAHCEKYTTLVIPPLGDLRNDPHHTLGKLGNS